MDIMTLRNNQVQKVCQLCKEYNNSSLAVENYKMCFTEDNRNEFVEHLDKLRAKAIEKKHELIKTVKNLD